MKNQDSDSDSSFQEKYVNIEIKHKDKKPELVNKIKIPNISNNIKNKSNNFSESDLPTQDIYDNTNEGYELKSRKNVENIRIVKKPNNPNNFSQLDLPAQEIYDNTNESNDINVRTNVENHEIETQSIPKKVTLSWKAIDVSASPTCFTNLKNKLKKNENPQIKRILKQVDGIVRPGQMLALMGASGSGKTTLLNVLNYRSGDNLKIEGEIMINGLLANSKKMSMISCYIQQDDLFFGTLTVKEHLEFHAILRMDRSVPMEKKRERVQEVLREFNLEICKDVKIGIPGRIKGISGGQMRRLSFASEILTDPPLLFCDEPTSGLDAFMAKSIVKCLQKMASMGKTIICTIHQPSSETFALFDRVCLLAEGRIAYFGERELAIDYFKTRLDLSCPQFTNPADFYINFLGLDVYNEVESRAKINDYCDIFKKSVEKQELDKNIENVENLNFNIPNNFTPYKSLWIDQLFNLYKRCYINYFRNYRVVINDLLMCILTALLGGMIYYQSAEKVDGICTFNQKAVKNLSTALFYAVTVMTIINVLAAALTFPLEIPIFIREHRTSVYRVDTYYLSKLLSEIPIYIVLPLIFSTIIYYMVAFGCSDKNFGLFLFTIILVAQCSFSLGHVISIIASNVNMAISLAAPVLAIQMLFCGFFLKELDTTPDFFTLLKYLSVFNYGYDLLIINQWENVDDLICEYSNLTQSLCKRNGKDILMDLDLSSENKSFLISMLFVLIIAWRLLAFIILFIKSSKRSVKINNCVNKINKPTIKINPSNENKNDFIVNLNEINKLTNDNIQYTTKI